MQTSLMFVDLKPLGLTPDSQKIAIKMPQGQNKLDASEYAGFADIINALMAITPEQLTDALGEMEWVPVQGESDGFAPLIDLSGAKENQSPMAQALIGQMIQKNSQQTAPLHQHSQKMAGWDNRKIDVLTSNTENSARPSLSQHHPDTLNKGTPLADASSDKIEITGRAEDGQKETIPQRFQTQLQMPDATHQTGNMKSVLKEEIPIQKDLHSADPYKDLSKRLVTDKDASQAAIVHSEGKVADTTKENMSDAARSWVLQNHSKDKMVSPAQPVDQQFAEGEGAFTEQFGKPMAKEQPKADLSHEKFSLHTTEGPTNALFDDTTDPSTGNKHESKEHFQPMASRTKMVSTKAVENVSGDPAPPSYADDMKSNVIRQIVQRMTLHTQGSQSTMTLKLKPEFLGNVHMQISTNNQQVVVRMATESLAVKEMVEQGLHFLKAEMQHHGLEIDKFDVFVADDNDTSHPGQDLAGFRQALKKRQQNAMKKNNDSRPDDGLNVSAETTESDQRINHSSEISYFA